MADPTLTNKLLILIGDGANPEVFGWPCGAENRSATLSNNTSEASVMDCEDPMGSLPAMKRRASGQDTQISISGRVATEYWPTWRAWIDSGEAKNVRIVLDESAAQNGGYYAMPAILTNFEFGEEQQEDMTFSATLVQADRRTWVDAA